MKRVLLKLSGEALAGDKKTGFDEATVTEVARQVKVLCQEGVRWGSSSAEEISGGEEAAKTSTEPSGSDRYAGHHHELYLCVGDLPVPGMKTSVLTPLSAVPLRNFFPKTGSINILPTRW